jgi:hypothetical protein
MLAGVGILVWALRQWPAQDRDRPTDDEFRDPSFSDEAAADDQVEAPAQPEPAQEVVESDFGRSDQPEPRLEGAGTELVPVVLEAMPDIREPDGVDERADAVAGEEVPYRAADPDELLVELADIRAEVIQRVGRRPLFVMAEERHLPYSRMLCMTKAELFEVVLEAEGVPPSDVRPSPETAERVRVLAAEAFRKDEEIAAEEAAQRAAS